MRSLKSLKKFLALSFIFQLLFINSFAGNAQPFDIDTIDGVPITNFTDLQGGAAATIHSDGSVSTNGPTNILLNPDGSRTVTVHPPSNSYLLNQIDNYANGLGNVPNVQDLSGSVVSPAIDAAAATAAAQTDYPAVPLDRPVIDFPDPTTGTASTNTFTNSGCGGGNTPLWGPNSTGSGCGGDTGSDRFDPETGSEYADSCGGQGSGGCGGQSEHANSSGGYGSQSGALYGGRATAIAIYCYNGTGGFLSGLPFPLNLLVSALASGFGTLHAGGNIRDVLGPIIGAAAGSLIGEGLGKAIGLSNGQTNMLSAGLGGAAASLIRGGDAKDALVSGLGSAVLTGLNELAGTSNALFELGGVGGIHGGHFPGGYPLPVGQGVAGATGNVYNTVINNGTINGDISQGAASLGALRNLPGTFGTVASSNPISQALGNISPTNGVRINGIAGPTDITVGTAGLGSVGPVSLGSINPSSVFSTPISLQWNKVKEESVAVQFPVSPAQQGKWFTWEASSNMPLLVYDKEKSGQITSAKQLFGNFSFGDNWNNGYEALSSLDKNQDGYLTNNELKYLSLWFDENRDGISQEGEVIDIKKLSVTKIMVKPNSTNILNGDLVAQVGYERVINGKTMYGKSIDWLSAGGFDSKEAAVGYIRKNRLARL